MSTPEIPLPELKEPDKRKKLRADQAAGLANQLLQNPVFQVALDAVRESYKNAAMATRPEDVAKREHYHKCFHALHDIEAALTGFIDHGKMQTMMNLKKQKAKK